MDFTRVQQEIVQQAMASEAIPGVSVALVKDLEIVAEGGFGVRSIAGELPVTAHTVTPICSLTKSLTGAAVMQLVEEGRVWLDEPVASYLPGFRTADDEASRKITPRMLLSHKSGIGRTGHQRRMFAEELSPYHDRGDLVSRLSDVELQTPPNSAWSYCNEGFVTLGHLTETLRGEPLEQCFQRRIFDPVGMAGTFTSFSRWRDSADRSRLYNKTGSEYEESHLPADYSIYLSTGGICSTAHDLALYQIATMSYADSPILTAGSLDQMHTVSMPFGDTGWGYGLGWSISWAGATKVVAHGGGLPGVSTYSLIVPSRGVGAVVLTNLGGAKANIIAERLVGTLLGAPLFRDDPEADLPFETRWRTSVESLREFAGEYAADEVGRAVVEAVGDGLNVTILPSEGSEKQETMSARAVAEDLFMMRQRGSVVSFVRDPAGDVTALLTGGSQYNRVGD